MTITKIPRRLWWKPNILRYLVIRSYYYFQIHDFVLSNSTIIIYLNISPLYRNKSFSLYQLRNTNSFLPTHLFFFNLETPWFVTQFGREEFIKSFRTKFIR